MDFKQSSRSNSPSSSLSDQSSSPRSAAELPLPSPSPSPRRTNQDVSSILEDYYEQFRTQPRLAKKLGRSDELLASSQNAERQDSDASKAAFKPNKSSKDDPDRKIVRRRRMKVTVSPRVFASVSMTDTLESGQCDPCRKRSSSKFILLNPLLKPRRSRCRKLKCNRAPSCDTCARRGVACLWSENAFPT